MLSTTDFKKLLFLYKMEGRNMSIQAAIRSQCRVT